MEKMREEAVSTEHSRLFNYLWAILKMSAAIIFIILFYFSGIPFWAALIISLSLYTYLQLSHFFNLGKQPSNNQRMKTVLKASIFTFFIMTLLFVVDSTISLVNNNQNSSMVSTGAMYIMFLTYLSIGYSFQKYLDTTVDSSISAMHASIWSLLVKYPILVAALILSFSYGGPPDNSHILSFAACIFFPAIFASAYLILHRIDIIGIFTEPKIFSKLFHNITKFCNNNTRDLKMDGLSIYRGILNSSKHVLSTFGIYTMISKFLDSYYVRRITTYDLPEKTHSFDLKEFVKLPIGVSIFMIIFDSILSQYGVYADIEVVTSNRFLSIGVAYMISFLYKSYLQGFLPEDIEPPTWLVAFFSLATSIEFLFYFPDLLFIRDVILIQVGVYLGYVWIHAGPYKGGLPISMGYIFITYAQLIPIIADYLDKTAGLSPLGLFFFYVLLSVMLVMWASCTIYGIYIIIDIIIGVPKAFQYLFITINLYYIVYRFGYIVGFLTQIDAGVISRIFHIILIFGRLFTFVLFGYCVLLLIEYVRGYMTVD